MIFTLQHFEVYIGSSEQPVAIFTDHNPLTFLQQMSNASHRLMQWSLICIDNLKICHKDGIVSHNDTHTQTHTHACSQTYECKYRS